MPPAGAGAFCWIWPDSQTCKRAGDVAPRMRAVFGSVAFTIQRRGRRPACRAAPGAAAKSSRTTRMPRTWPAVERGLGVVHAGGALHRQIGRGIHRLQHAARHFLRRSTTTATGMWLASSEMPKPFTSSSTSGIRKAIRMAEGSRRTCLISLRSRPRSRMAQRRCPPDACRARVRCGLSRCEVLHQGDERVLQRRVGQRR